MLHNLLKNTDIILASRSPRRKILLEQVGLDFRQIPSAIEETEKDISSEEFVIHYSREKAKKIHRSFPNSLIIGADTVVLIDGKRLGKPADKIEAKYYLQQLSANSHTVLTGITVLYQEKIISEIAKTKVFFHAISEMDLQEYVETEEPMDKAGAYGIQGFGSQFIKKIEGCYFNVMGFPIPLFYEICREIKRED
ncbi:MAG: nucleoside triphosphate pyrophosphatase [Candidatus Cloacimonadota bacterium]|nr:nucleoside triphosphate pyrophosphatase [Candidatus Cloacimonadota bacterium]